MRNILFILPSVNLSGSPLSLLRYLEIASIPKEWQLYFYTKGGELTSEFSKYGKVIKPTGRNFLKPLFWKRIVPFFLLCIRGIMNRFSMVYANNLISLEMLHSLPLNKNIPIVIHAHELGLTVDSLSSSCSFHISKNPTSFIATSKITKEYLLTKLEVNEEIRIFPPLISKPKFIHPRYKIRQKLSIENDDILVGYLGTVSYKKGYAEFIQLAFQLKKIKKIKFIYIGPFDINKSEVEFDIANAGLMGKIQFLGGKAFPGDYLNALDIFVSCSKEESFGMSIVEAAAYNLPLICFKRTGMQSVLVKSAGGVLIDFFDILKMAEAIKELAFNPLKKKKMGITSYQMASKYLMTNNNSDLWIDHLEKVMNTKVK